MFVIPEKGKRALEIQLVLTDSAAITNAKSTKTVNSTYFEDTADTDCINMHI